ncbi:hypothetical protein CANCADRAFT_147776 [Tortispora caseinolytica NRRL Y-17796]|uniref:HAD-superfamily subfamily IIA hydrolase n=1 Tax=Tortispora caseinolytica NRRL Y-17796 TaxID=767744 RepID=A0A1E4TDT5_9ASCO|nr:hypothetical protein CANCADRAFT_147776 [Tortispora caseinolytica NRRL Y-17796]
MLRTAHRAPQRAFSQCVNRRKSLDPTSLAFAFDIDGVLVRGKRALDHGRQAIQHLNSVKVPYILLTNGGGKTERARTEELSRLLETDIPEHILVQSHTPIRSLFDPDVLVDRLDGKGKRHRRVLVVGGAANSCAEVAKSYGYKDVVTPSQIYAACRAIWPFSQLTEEQLLKIPERQMWTFRAGPGAIPEPPDNVAIDGILVFTDPRDWGLDAQVVLDYLRSDRGLLGTISDGAHVPIFFCNDDLVFANDYAQPRLGNGAFREMVKSLYRRLSGGTELVDTVIGKPYKTTYDYAAKVLADRRAELHGNGLPPLDPDRIYMVGDNPASDITGGRAYGWHTILVRTGVFRDGQYTADANIISDSVSDAVNYGMSRE